MPRSFSLVLAVAVSLLSACATQIGNDLTPQETGAKAIAIISVTHDLQAGNSANAIVYLDGGEVLAGQALASRPGVMPGIYKRSSDYTDRRGQLYVLDLEPGVHRITSWQLENRNARLRPQTPPAPLTFEVRAGEAVYLGDIHLSLAMGRNWFGQNVAGDAVPVIEDRSYEDIPRAFERVPALQGRVVPGLLPLGVWSGDAGYGDGYGDGSGPGTYRQPEPLPVFVPSRR